MVFRSASWPCSKGIDCLILVPDLCRLESGLGIRISSTEFLVVFRRYDNSKRVIALLGVMLALSSSAQQVRLYCYLIGCAPSSGDIVESDRTDYAAHTGCARCRATKATTGPIHQHDGVNEGGNSCPCPQHCWCRQAPEPFELPRNGVDLAEVLLFSTLFCPSMSIAEVVGEPPSPDALASEVVSSEDSATKRCARLCRFLI